MTINVASATAQLPLLTNALEKARQRQLALGDLFNIATILSNGGHQSQAVELYKGWIAYNDGNPLLHLAYFNYAVAANVMGDRAGAINAFRACLKLDPQFGPAHINLGRVLEDSGLINPAVEQWRSYAEITSDITADRLGHRLMTLKHIGRVLEGAGRMEEAEKVLWQAMELQPEKTDAGQHWTSLRQRQCKWPVLVPSEHVSLRQLLDAVSPLTLGCYADDPLFQLAKAHRYNKSLIGQPDLDEATANTVPRHKTGTGQRLRVGYVSSDLRDHAVGFALREVLELHDKSSVEVFAYYCGDRRTNDATQERIRNAVDCWRDIAEMSDADAAKLIAKDKIDILIDVNGYTKLARTKIFAYRPAPVVVNFCGYPGSLASPFHQYIIADEHIIPPANEIYYTEKVLRIACNQPIDRKRQIDARPTRAEAGLPEDAFVYACFNGMQKITANCFDRWMTILSETPGSVLWLLADDDTVNQRLREIAAKRGVDADRIIFAAKAPNPKHLARIGLADLFLDTFPYGAHSTAADAITVGLPILTVSGKTFASRFCGSIVAAAGLPELICGGPDEYVRQAIAFAHDRKSLQDVRDRLQSQRETSVLRDIPGLARRLEQLFWEMQDEAERGETPVPDMRNLEIYYEIGADIVLTDVEFEDEIAYRNRYLEKLGQLNANTPIPFDRRLWTEPAE
ncbi:MULTISPECIES: O-linked N-acetylglucosamine transferase, SPINDLY family protein [unclassified Rhizobium]|uniref:O-linked N-acetylglucosamine transferase, SPINDLY family protein n=1 Tax=unclassified Rhizobium TaxID=2613769 RepID=UPI001ADD334C|nr:MULTISPECIES: glycosyl transferase [unclassified Rhizobium]MBO9099742.1 glycosyl transferase [Rhizobium sp. L58/93]MBO9131715.1 glycosyl transferase [Rhizobium sp. B209b/85]MBO9169731.1 glycosyl transferase [Rhizobium sp. L245/93]MBO9185689.1 glycosyl transferase [Rhizobium sp. E27B/91]QXZ82454.1 glycosyl transferase [Rhizobium sp. K1/93]